MLAGVALTEIVSEAVPAIAVLLTVKAVRFVKKRATEVKDIFTNKSDIRSILKRKGASPSKKIPENEVEMSLLIPETGTELFSAYKNLLEEEAAMAYEQKNVIDDISLKHSSLGLIKNNGKIATVIPDNSSQPVDS